MFEALNNIRGTKQLRISECWQNNKSKIKVKLSVLRW
jgi:hypothetical protein